MTHLFPYKWNLADGKRMVAVSGGYVYTSVAEVAYGTEEEALGGSERWNEAAGWGDHAQAGYLNAASGGAVAPLSIYPDSDSTPGLDSYSYTGAGVIGRSDSDIGVKGMSDTGIGVYALSSTQAGIWAQSKSGNAAYMSQQGALTGDAGTAVVELARHLSGAYSINAPFLNLTDAPTVSGSITGALIRGVIGSVEKVLLYPRIGDSASAVAYMLDTLNTLATAGAKLLSLRNNGVEKFAVNYDGSILSPAFKTTSEGGQAIRLVNKTGAASVKGTVVSVSNTTDNAFRVNPVDGDMPIGIVYEDGIADGSDCWVVISGKAQVLLVNSVATTRSYVAYSSATVAGRIDTAASAPAATQHFREIGHTLESKTAGTNVLVLCILHFN